MYVPVHGPPRTFVLSDMVQYLLVATSTPSEPTGIFHHRDSANDLPIINTYRTRKGPTQIQTLEVRKASSAFGKTNSANRDF